MQGGVMKRLTRYGIRQNTDLSYSIAYYQYVYVDGEKVEKCIKHTRCKTPLHVVEVLLAAEEVDDGE